MRLVRPSPSPGCTRRCAASSAGCRSSTDAGAPCAAPSRHSAPAPYPSRATPPPTTPHPASQAVRLHLRGLAAGGLPPGVPHQGAHRRRRAARGAARAALRLPLPPHRRRRRRRPRHLRLCPRVRAAGGCRPACRAGTRHLGSGAGCTPRDRGLLMISARFTYDGGNFALRYGTRSTR